MSTKPVATKETPKESRMERVSFFGAVLRGFKRRCPDCGIGAAFAGYLTVADSCNHCGEKLGHIRADDAPPYFTILIVGHIVVGLGLMIEKNHPMSTGETIAILVAMTLALMFAFLPRIKGAVLNVMWRLGLSGSEFQ